VKVYHRITCFLARSGLGIGRKCLLALGAWIKEVEKQRGLLGGERGSTEPDRTSRQIADLFTPLLLLL